MIYDNEFIFYSRAYVNIIIFHGISSTILQLFNFKMYHTNQWLDEEL